VSAAIGACSPRFAYLSWDMQQGRRRRRIGIERGQSYAGLSGVSWAFVAGETGAKSKTLEWGNRGKPSKCDWLTSLSPRTGMLSASVSGAASFNDGSPYADTPSGCDRTSEVQKRPSRLGGPNLGRAVTSAPPARMYSATLCALGGEIGGFSLASTGWLSAASLD